MPVERVSWNDAVAFSECFNKEGKGSLMVGILLSLPKHNGSMLV